MDSIKGGIRLACLLCFWVVALGNQALGAVYVKDVVPIGPTGYSLGSIRFQAPTTNAIVGCSGRWTGDTGTIIANRGSGP